MKKNELTNLQIGSKVESKKTGEVLVINNIVEVEGKVKYELDNNKTVAQSSMLRWYNLVEQEVVEQVEIETLAVEVEPTPEVKPVEIKPVEVQPAQQPVEPQPEVKPVEVKPIEVKPANNLAEQIFEYCNNHQDIYTIKHNKDHSVIKGVNKKNLVEIYASKKAVNVAVRQDLYTEEEQMVLDNARIVGNGTFTLDLKFVVHSINEFISVLNRATQYVPPKKSRK